MKKLHKYTLYVFAGMLFALLSQVNSVIAQTTEVCERVTYPYGTYTQWSVTGQGCSAVGTTRDVPGTEAPAPAPTQVPVYVQPTAVPSTNNTTNTNTTLNDLVVGGEILGGACSVPYSYGANGSLICSPQCGNVWRSAAGGCPSGIPSATIGGQNQQGQSAVIVEGDIAPTVNILSCTEVQNGVYYIVYDIHVNDGETPLTIYRSSSNDFKWVDGTSTFTNYTGPGTTLSLYENGHSTPTQVAVVQYCTPYNITTAVPVQEDVSPEPMQNVPTSNPGGGGY